VKDLLSGLSAGGWGLVAGWITPAVIATVVVAYGVLPDAPLGLAEDVGARSASTQALSLAVAAVSAGLVLNAVQTPLYRMLEGYLAPERVRAWGVERHRRRRTALLGRMREATGLEYGLLVERLQAYPVQDDQIAPTRLGNAIRALETYGWDRYRLDSQTLWCELEAVVPTSLRHEIERARAPVDFCVAALYLTLIVGLGLLVFAVADGARWLVGGVIALGLLPLWYALAATATGYWYAAVQALVNLGRVPLAVALYLEIPADIEREREMWERASIFVRREYAPRRSARLDRFRALNPLSVAEMRPGDAHPRIVLSTDDVGRNHIQVRAADGRVLAASEPYESRTAALTDLSLLHRAARESVMIEGARPAQVDPPTDDTGGFPDH
jgi:uncharacterized protein YegP (UPF0339 family)